MKRALSVVLTLAMLISMCTVFFVTSVAAATVITNSSPAITADVGEKITLSSYSVVFDGDVNATSDVTWKNGGSTITSFTPSAKGVTVLTATSGSKSKDIYVVAKNSTESEYVLYEATMSNYTIDQLKAEGWTFCTADNSSFTKNSDGSLAVTQSDWGVAWAYLPEWLGDFGDYGIEAEMKMANTVANDRWMALVYHATARTVSANYTQFAIRKNTTVYNGLEFAEKNNGTWNVMTTTAGSYTDMTSAYRTVAVEVKDGNVSYSLAGNQALYVPKATYTSSAKSYRTKGYLGISVSGASALVKSIKVTVQKNVPEEVPTNLNLIFNNKHNTDNLINAVANAQKVTTVTAANLEGLTVAYIDLTTGINATTAYNACIAANVVPVFYITTNAQADAVVSAANSAGITDISVVSNSTSVLSYIYGKNYMIRRGLKVDLSSAMADGTITESEGHSIRYTARGASATFIVIDSKYATKHSVSELQEFALGVWVNCSSTSAATDAFKVEAAKVVASGANGIISVSAAGVSSVVENNFVENSITRTPIMIGHRGNPQVAPENTIESFQAAYDNGCDIFELDIDVTSDGVVVVLHDTTLARTTTSTDSTTLVSDMTWAQVKQYNVLNLDGTDSGKPIPTLSEVLDWAKDKDIKIFLEFKSWQAASDTTIPLNLVISKGMQHKVDCITFFQTAVNATYSTSSGMSLGFLYEPNIPSNTYGQALSFAYNAIEESQKNSRKASANPSKGTVTEYTVRALTDRGITIWPWTYAASDTSKAFFICPDGITTDNAECIADMAKLLHADDFSMFVGQTYAGGAIVAETYGDDMVTVDGKDTVVSVISGSSVAVENGKLVAVSEGTSTVIFGYRTASYTGDEYVVYSEPVTVTVDNGDVDILRPLMAIAETATIKSLSEEDLATLRELYAEAKVLVNSSNPSESAIQETATAMAELVNKFLNVTYTTTAPNYVDANGVLKATYADDNMRLIDGVKGYISGASANYSAWQRTSDGIVEVIVDYGRIASNDTFSAYFAGDEWGVHEPENMTVSYSDNGDSWTSLAAKVAIEKTSESTTVNDGEWSTWKYTVKSGIAINARYIKYIIEFDADSNFIWMDEVEASDSQFDLVYVNGINEKIEAGDCHIFTPAFGTVSTATANHTWSANVKAKWDNDEGAFIVTEVTHGWGSGESNTPSVTLNAGEILICAHGWEDGITDGTAVSGSEANEANVFSATKGQKIEFYGIDIENWELGIAPSLRFVDADDSHEHTYAEEWISDGNFHWQECECGDKANVASHIGGDWVVKTPATTETEGLKEKYCTVCGKLTDTETIPVLAPEHTHEGIGGWVTDETNHWHICACGEKVDSAAHNGKWVVRAEAEIGKDGLKELRCSECDYLMNSETIPALEETDDNFLLGDINNNGSVDMTDYILAKRAYFGTYKLTEDEFKRGNVNFNEEMDMTDYILIKRVYFGTYSFEQ